MSRLIVQVGWRRTLKDGQLINAWVDGDEINWDTFPGYWLTPQQSRESRYIMWHAAELDVEPGAIISISVKTGIRKVGPDESRILDLSYITADKSADVMEVKIPGVGFGNYPILKGRVLEIKKESMEQARGKGSDDFFDRGF